MFDADGRYIIQWMLFIMLLSMLIYITTSCVRRSRLHDDNGDGYDDDDDVSIH